MGKRLYKDIDVNVEGYCVYAHQDPFKECYFGMTDRPKERWQPSQYNGNFRKHIDEVGWDNFNHIVIQDGLTYKQARAIEGMLIKQAKKDGFCLNERNSGVNDRKEYDRNWENEQYQNNPEYKAKLLERQKTEKYKEYQRKATLNKRSKPEYKIYRRVGDFNRYHPDQIKETPLEAKQKYLQWGYIPNYIKSDDLIN